MTVAQRPAAGEFIALIAMLFATIALSIDAMLPALPDIAAAMSPQAPNRAQLVVTSFVFGMGLGTLIAGPLSDAFGRKPVILISAGLYMLASLLCYVAPSLETLLIARVLQGIGAAAPRAVGTAMVRDLFKGREMARLISFVMMIFTLVPAVAPLLGQGIILIADWRAIFLAFIAFSGLTTLWIFLRQPETLPASARRPLRLRLLAEAGKELLTHRTALLSTAAQSLTQACLFATLSSMQGIFEQRFHRAESFPLWFAVIAVCAISGSLLNARLVMHKGMRSVLVGTYAAQVVLTGSLLALLATGGMPDVLAFPAHILWSIGILAMMGLCLGNLNAVAMEDLGHIAGFAASVISAISTMASVLLAVPVGLAFNGTALPLMTGVVLFATLALALTLLVRRPSA